MEKVRLLLFGQAVAPDDESLKMRKVDMIGHSRRFLFVLTFFVAAGETFVWSS